MLPLLSLLACTGSPTVTVSSSPHPDAPMPPQLADLLDSRFRRPIQACYEQALADQQDLAGTVSYAVFGSHGILAADVSTSAGPVLDACAQQPMSDSRLMRVLGDGDKNVGFVVTVQLTPG